MIVSYTREQAARRWPAGVGMDPRQRMAQIAFATDAEATKVVIHRQRGRTPEFTIELVDGSDIDGVFDALQQQCYQARVDLYRSAS